MSQLIDLTGKKFGRLAVIQKENSEKGKSVKWLCQCECGNFVSVQGGSLKAGKTKSCGCYNREVATKLCKERSTHNLSRTPFYIAWLNMKARCENTNKKEYKHYGGRGIKVCDKWKNFEIFYEDMYSSYKRGLTLDRIDVNGNYCKENCRWITIQEQSNNKRSNIMFTIEEHTDNLKNLCTIYNINYYTAYGRLLKGLPIERVLKDKLQCGIKFQI
jgi:hypothetical protein